MLGQSESNIVRRCHHTCRSTLEQRKAPSYLLTFLSPLQRPLLGCLDHVGWKFQSWEGTSLSPMESLQRRERENLPNDMLCLKWNVPDNKTPCDKVLARLSLTFGTGSERRNNRLGKNSLLNCSPDSTFSSNRFWQSCAYLWITKKC